MKHKFFKQFPDACVDAKKWAEQFNSLEEAWEKCERSDWMMWALKKINILSKNQSVQLAVVFAEHVLPLFTKKYPNDNRPFAAINAAKQWINNPCDIANAAAAYAAAYAAYAAADANAADAAAAAAADDAAAAAADADAAAAYAAADANAADAAEKKWQSNKIRELIPNPFKGE